MAPAPSSASSPAPRLARRTYIVDRRFQLKYTAMIAGLGAVCALIFGALMYLPLRDGGQQLPPGMALGLIVGLAILMGIALALVGVLVTHRVAGPIYVMSHYIGVLARGRYPIMRPLRRSDELKDFFERFQGAIEALRTRDAEEAELIERAMSLLEPVATSAEAKEALETLRTVHDRKRDASDRVDIGAAREKNAA